MIEITEDTETETGITKPWGVIHCPVTPMTNDGEIAYDKLPEFVSYGVDAGVDGVMSCATTAEFASMTYDEWQRVTKITIEESGDLPVFCNVTAESLKKTKRMAHFAEENGADGVICSNPYYWLYNDHQENLRRFYKELAQDIETGLSIYNYPIRTKNNTTPSTLIKLVADEELDNVVGIKESNPDLHELLAKLRLTDEYSQFNVGIGANTFFPFSLAGLNTAWCVTTNIDPDLIVDLWAACRAGEWERAKELQFKASRLLGILFGQDYPANIKCALDLLGRSAGPPRSPIYMPGDKRRERLARKLDELGYDVQTA
ncbi:dihydrodipicolinate synthase family protein [Natronomonas halophila]|uniref:dihydrodipicolinate synthase family protein n=1 Tax=Natronomonas halophila TaxID=2747817 RepID=UPI0015B405E8|nr:dihydrodipicolinate synthase family protein [Natronomonas halophila]QLD86143.1 dihydrodipicolinate synthase family protein [Natronomonas halophila]